MSDSFISGRRSVKEIFFGALEKNTSEERAAFLDGACGTNLVQRARVEAMLADHSQADTVMKAAGHPEDPTILKVEPAPGQAPAQMLGRYKLLEQIGEGGFGEVWMAEQREPVKRRVALKLIKLGMDSRQIVARFEAERQALAMMDHANIAKIFDASVTDTGRPYFVMELVRGIKITEYCDENHLPTKERLDLFVKVCQAIQHAHQKGIIHRDIKPSNILVTLQDGVAVPKVIDFGIAKATQGELTDRTVFTQFQQFIGTPAYISPEQAEMSGSDIDTRADIYSLGVLLYELLVGQTPFDPKEMMKGGLDVLRRIIREQEAPRPSTKLKTLLGTDLTSTAQRRHTDPVHLGHQLRGDLDWIVMKCLEKNRTRRYDTASALAMDIQRHLANEPVVARPPSTAYRIQKAWHRNKLVFSTGGVVVLALLTGLTLAATGWRQSRVERDRALQSRAGEEVQRKAAQAGAVAAQEQRQLAEEREQTVRRYLYTAQINRAQQSWKDGNIAQARDLLSSLRPNPGEEDPRGFEWRYLWRLCQDQSIFTFRGHSLGVQSMAISPDGKTLASAAVGDGGHEIMLWDIVTRLKIAGFATGADARCIAFSPDGLALAAKPSRLRAPMARSGYGKSARNGRWSLCAGTRRGSLRQPSQPMARFWRPPAWMAPSNSGMC
jgi:eukaryotic-like serine/threonine-protein kinase